MSSTSIIVCGCFQAQAAAAAVAVAVAALVALGNQEVNREEELAVGVGQAVPEAPPLTSSLCLMPTQVLPTGVVTRPVSETFNSHNKATTRHFRSSMERVHQSPT